MADKPTLLLHIGTHKTATTTLQALMADNRAMLAAQGFCYADTARPPKPAQNHHGSLRQAMVGGSEKMRAERDVLVRNFVKSGCHTLVVSAESLSEPRLMRPERLSQIAILAENFTIKTVCVCRRQDYFIESFWNQRSTTKKNGLHIDTFVADTDNLRHMSYLNTLDAWATHGTVKAIGFEASRELGIVQAFSAATGITLPDETVPHNVSPTMTIAATMAALNRNDLNLKWWAVEEVVGPGEKRTALGSRLRAELLARFADQNKQLREKYGLNFPEDMPDEPEDPIAAPSDDEAARIAAAVVQANTPSNPKRALRKIGKTRKTA